MTKTWSEVYINKEIEKFGNIEAFLNRDWQSIMKKKTRLRQNFFNLILKNANNGKPIIECGSGTGITTSYLSSLGYECYGIDLDQNLVYLSQQLSSIISPQNKPHFFIGDINKIPFDDKFFSVSHSHGVLEHFNDDQIITILNEQLRVADKVIFSVPSTYFNANMTDGHVFGDERYLTNKEWVEIIKQSNGTLVSISGDHQRSLKKRMLKLINNPLRILKPKAFSVFEIHNNN